MFYSTLQKFFCLFIILSSAVLAHSQSAPQKEATGVVSGKVTIRGKAAPGVTILLQPYSENSVLRLPSYKAATDLNGEYRIANVPAGNYNVLPLAPALVDASGSSQRRTLLLGKGETVDHIDFALVRGGAITGKIVDADARPVVEQEVRIYALAFGDQRFPMTSTMTDDRGVYRVFGLKAGRYKVAAGQGERAGMGNRSIFYQQTFYPAASELEQAGVIEVGEGGEVANIDITLGPSLVTYT